jgi:hypothetical protein
MKNDNRLPPEPSARAVIALYRALSYLTDVLMQDDQQAVEHDDFMALRYLTTIIAQTLEGAAQVHPAVSRAAERFLKKAVKLEHRADELLFPREVIERIEPSPN